MIRQAISCDICGTEKRQTNHWFVAYEQGGELRVSGWGSGRRLRAESKHLCGQTCLHKLVDEFMARSIASPAKSAADENETVPAHGCDTSLTSPEAYPEIESAARLIPAIVPVPAAPARVPQMEIVAMPSQMKPAELRLTTPEPQRYPSRTWRTEAWERERERELRANENRPDFAARRRSQLSSWNVRGTAMWMDLVLMLAAFLLAFRCFELLSWPASFRRS